MCFERSKKKSIKPTQRRSSVISLIQTLHHSALHDFGLRGLLSINNVNSATCLLLCIGQSKHRHELFCAWANQTPTRVFIVHFPAPEPSCSWMTWLSSSPSVNLLLRHYISLGHQQIARGLAQSNSLIEYVHGGHIGGPKQKNDIPLGNKCYFYANIFNCFGPPTWPPCTYSIGILIPRALDRPKALGNSMQENMRRRVLIAKNQLLEPHGACSLFALA